ncbi:xylulokinase [Benzoatithermus flavus]|uniref:FGGY family carbohydrate kinase n=1 Tax=Benzoatithermus flavus TaxID=3108223 RepID=A0ABU8XT66_9PROT
MDLVVGIDSSTTSTKAIAWDGQGRMVAEGRAAVPMQNLGRGHLEQSVEDWWRALQEALADLFRQVDPVRVAALAVSNQRETVGFLDADGNELRPAILWLDDRCRPDIELFCRKLGRDRFLAITGKTPDPTPAVFSLHWLMRCEPEHWRKLAHAVDVLGYLGWRLTGERVTSWGSADPHGVLDLPAKRYSPEILAALGLEEERFFPPVRPGSIIGEVTPEAAAATGLRPGTLVVAGGGDGQAAGLGTATLGGGRAYLNLGTAAVSGVWGEAFATSPAFRTLTSLSGEGYIYEICLRTGAFLIDWSVGRLFGIDPKAEPGIYDRLEAEAAAVPPGADGLLLLPYWSGSMTPFWDPDARGAVVGFGTGHARGHYWRALLEGIALDLAMGYAAIEEATGEPIQELLTIGGAAKSSLMRRIVADATGKAIRISSTIEASCLGAGMLAATGAGWYRTAAEAARAMQGEVLTTVEPDPSRTPIYRELLDVYRDLYPALRDSFARLAGFCSRQDG